ncbi:manganese-dependent ADP-ribose/CDP-alcohol diphosphatase-like [Dendropsophus ebraccatus]|uniref:manganese-dependent ADP-ribose/CDP-alcohol diphosphatase-like n=1 Tax=Dendropsophus ebraccatus TaxID=150705 RepID=UPI00383152DE
MGETQNMRCFRRHGQPYFTFGVIADIQYAEKPDGPSAWNTMRYYSQSCPHLKDAIKEWNAEDVTPKFVLQLGDIIDSFNKRVNTSEASVEKIISITKTAKMPFHHVWGNHELYNFPRDELMVSKLNSTWLADKKLDVLDPNTEGTSEKDYYAYHFSPHTKFRFIVIDTYDLGIFGRESTSAKLQKSLDFLESAEAYSNETRAFHLVQLNGGIDKEQLTWLDNILTYSDKMGERVIIAGHIPIHPKAKCSNCLVWNYDEILRTIQSHQSVVCYFAGHEHSGGYHQDSHGIHHITMEGVVESPPGSNAFGTVFVYEDGMLLQGRGRVRDRFLPYRMTSEINTSCFTCAGVR